MLCVCEIFRIDLHKCAAARQLLLDETVEHLLEHVVVVHDIGQSLLLLLLLLMGLLELSLDLIGQLLHQSKVLVQLFVN